MRNKNLKQYFTKENGLRLLILALFLALFAWAIVWANSGYNRDRGITDTTGVEYETARVEDILEDKTVPDENIEGRLRGSKILTVEILTGR